MTQLALFQTFSVHCFFGWCDHVVREGDPFTAHAAMEAHYRAVHAATIARLAGSVKA